MKGEKYNLLKREAGTVHWQCRDQIPIEAMDTQNYSQQFEKCANANRKTGHGDDRYSTRMLKRAQGSCSFKAPSLVLRAIVHLELL